MKYTIIYNDADQQFEITGISENDTIFLALDYDNRTIKVIGDHPRKISNRVIRRFFRAKIRQSLPPLIDGKIYKYLSWCPARGWQWIRTTCDLSYRPGHAYFRDEISITLRSYIPVHQPTGYTLTYKAA